MELTHAHIAEYLNVDIKTVKRVISMLKEKELIKVVRKMLGNIYLVQWENAQLFAPIFDKIHDQLYERIGRKTGEQFFKGNNYYITNVNNNYQTLFSNTPIGVENKVSLKKRLSRLRRRGKETENTNAWYDALIKPNEPLPKAEAPKNIPKDVKAIIEYWKFVGLPVSKDTTKSYRNDILAIKRALNGRMFEGQRYSLEEVKKAITDFSGAALDPSYEPGNTEIKNRLAKMHIDKFLMNHYAKNGDRSLFLRYLNNPPKRIIPLLKDENPAITDRIKRFYFKRVLKKEKALTDIEENKFREATSKLLKFIRKPEVNRCMKYMQHSNADLADMLCKCVVQRARDRDKIITPGWFCSDITFDEALPKMFKEQGLMESPYEDPQEYRYGELY